MSLIRTGYIVPSIVNRIPIVNKVVTKNSAGNDSSDSDLRGVLFVRLVAPSIPLTKTQRDSLNRIH
jgi:hypothetical protein